MKNGINKNKVFYNLKTLGNCYLESLEGEASVGFVENSAKQY